MCDFLWMNVTDIGVIGTAFIAGLSLDCADVARYQAPSRLNRFVLFDEVRA